MSVSRKSCAAPWLLFVMAISPALAEGGRFAGRPDADAGRLPWNRDLMIAPVKSLEPLAAGESRVFVEHAGVPCVIRDAAAKGRLVSVFQWFPMEESNRNAFDQVALRISTDDGKTWGSPRPVTISGLDPQRYQRPMDPAILQLPDGRFRLFFTSSDRMQDRMQGSMEGSMQERGPGRMPAPPGGNRMGGPRIYSAISSDLRTFTFEEGVRSDRADSPVVDASVAYHAGAHYMVAHPEGRTSPFDVRQGYFAASADGSSFERRMNLGISIEGDFIGNLFSSQGRLFFFGGGPRGIWSMSSKDAVEWSRPAISALRGGDPSVFTDGAGKQWIVYVGDIRPDAVGHLSWMPGPQGPGSGGGPRMDMGGGPQGGQGGLPVRIQGGMEPPENGGGAHGPRQ